MLNDTIRARSSQLFVAILLIAALALQSGQVVLAAEYASSAPEKRTDPDKRHSNQGSQGLPTDQIIIKYKTQAADLLIGPASADQTQRLSEAAGAALTYSREISGDAHVLRLAERMPEADVQAIARRLMALPEVEYAEPDAIMQPTLLPNDPQYPNQWHYGAPAANNYGINAPAAWEITQGSASIVVAVIDTGITNHAEFTGRIVPGYDFVHDTDISNDGDGFDSNPSDPGDWVTPAESASGPLAGCEISDSSWHGTHTAGTIGAVSNNGVGVAGINWNSKILPVRVLGKCGGYTSDIADGMRWAAGLSITGVPANTNPAKVLNISLGGSDACSITYQDAVNAITATGATVVVAAGNSNTNASGFQPANCNGVVTVSATNRTGSRAYYSNYGSVVEISAPGGDTYTTTETDGILSTLNSGTQGPVADIYEYYQGTSMAAPHVAGVVSLLYSVNPALTPSQVAFLLQSTATAFPAGSTCTTSTCGSGIVNAGAAVAAASNVQYTYVNLPLVQNNYNSFLTTITQGFEDGVMPPTGWSYIRTNPRETWGIDNFDPHSGTYYANVLYDDISQQNEVLLSPSISATTAQLEFYSYGQLYWCKVDFNNCDLNIWVVKGAWGGADDVKVYTADNDWVSTFTWAKSQVNLTPYITPGQPFMIGFQYYGFDGAEAALDDIKITYIP